MHLLNRSRESQRCRARACRVVNQLTSMCLPGTSLFWKTLVQRKPVWSDLRPNSSMTALEEWKCAETCEVVRVMPFPGLAGCFHKVNLTGYHGKSRYDLHVALYATIAVMVVGLKQ